jgi:hypothetical protein
MGSRRAGHVCEARLHVIASPFQIVTFKMHRATLARRRPPRGAGLVVVQRARATGVQNVNTMEDGVTDLRKENPKLEPDPGSNTEKPPEEWVSGAEPMTGAQASYLTTLCEEAKRPPPAGDLTKAHASKLIDELKTELGR